MIPDIRYATVGAVILAFILAAVAARAANAVIRRDAAWGALVLGPLEIVGIESLTDGAATVRVKFKTQPLNQARWPTSCAAV